MLDFKSVLSSVKYKVKCIIKDFLNWDQDSTELGRTKDTTKFIERSLFYSSVT